MGAGLKSSQNSAGHHHRGHGVTDRGSNRSWRITGSSGIGGQTTEGLDQEILAWPFHIKSPGSIAAGRAVEQARIKLGNPFETKTQAIHHSRTEVLHYHVYCSNETIHDLPRLGVFQIQSQTPL